MTEAHEARRGHLGCSDATTLPLMSYGVGDVVVGRFELLEQIGEGRFREVFRALDLTSQARRVRVPPLRPLPHPGPCSTPDGLTVT